MQYWFKRICSILNTSVFDIICGGLKGLIDFLEEQTHPVEGSDIWSIITSWVEGGRGEGWDSQHSLHGVANIQAPKFLQTKFKQNIVEN